MERAHRPLRPSSWISILPSTINGAIDPVSKKDHIISILPSTINGILRLDAHFLSFYFNST